MADGTAAAWVRLERALPNLGIPGVTLVPGATPAAVAAFETAINVALPTEVAELFHGHDGQSSTEAGLAGGFYFVSLREAQQLMTNWADTRAQLGEGLRDLDRACRSQPTKAIQRKYSLAGWVPLLRDSEGNAIGADLDPGPNGAIGQIINFGRDEEEKFVLFANATELLGWLANELEANRMVLDPHDKVVRHVNGRLVAAILEARSPVA